MCADVVCQKLVVCSVLGVVEDVKHKLRERLKEMIREESVEDTLPDRTFAERLQAEGFPVKSRRCVFLLRNELGIPKASDRGTQRMSRTGWDLRVGGPVTEALKELLEREKTVKVAFSDAELAEQLRRGGLKASEWLVTKHRKALGVPAAGHRAGVSKWDVHHQRRLDLIQQAVSGEDPYHPVTDRELIHLLKESGYPRTSRPLISALRKKLGIASATARGLKPLHRERKPSAKMLARVECLRGVVQGEDPRHPYPDRVLAEIMEERGHPVSKGQVFALRRWAGIPSSCKGRMRDGV
jgi:DNA-directed RNA polymerase specialized sigma54-like protein